MIKSQQGIGLVEVIVSLLLLAVATLGFVAMQGGAMKLTSESEERTRSLAIMRDISEKIRLNPEAIETYVNEINSPESPTQPGNDCGLSGGADVKCTAEQLAIAHSYYVKQKVEGADFNINIRPCPSTESNGDDSVMYSHCIISAWGDTTPTVGNDTDGSDGEMDCLSDEGGYNPDATCMQIGLD